MHTLDIFKKKLTYKNYSQATIRSYLHYAEKFLRQLNKPPTQATLSDVICYLQNKNYSSVSQQNQIIGALKLYAKYVMQRKLKHVNKIERPRRVKRLPRVLDGLETMNKIKNISNIKHKAILAVAFCCALRVSELLNLTLADIDRNRMVLHIKQAKGFKDRVVPINYFLLHLLECYYKSFKPVHYLFNGLNGSKYSSQSCNMLVKNYIDKQSSMHTLRHTCATYMHEQGVDLATIKTVLGHSQIKTTMLYLRISSKTLSKISIPFT